ncbi:MAG: hypothetical protein QOD42_3160 [Sphingomonadales bacterium]|nr:hypothetical protein [Sphingomonadales bacterium]
MFKITLNGVYTILHSFGATPTDGIVPVGGLTQASDGNFYGTTVNGGTCPTIGAGNECGTAFRITPAGVLTILHFFGTSLTDGIAPQGPLILGSDGAFYGTTPSGGGGICGFQSGCGTVFRMTAAGSVTILYAFAVTNARADGYGPRPFLIQARDGNFYGVTGSGGATAADLNGTVFRLTPSGVKTILYSFGPLNMNPSNPEGGADPGRRRRLLRPDLLWRRRRGRRDHIQAGGAVGVSRQRGLLYRRTRISSPGASAISSQLSPGPARSTTRKSLSASRTSRKWCQTPLR